MPEHIPPPATAPITVALNDHEQGPSGSQPRQGVIRARLESQAEPRVVRRLIAAIAIDDRQAVRHAAKQSDPILVAAQWKLQHGRSQPSPGMKVRSVQGQRLQSES
ncbi:MAG TPA: hypothetical protein VN461_03970, partial [Vicinamibacteria bacterium]|nr:hypothetical protein [Vicinamibacteria bacterium]